jgi:hypothetical protein
LLFHQDFHYGFLKALALTGHTSITCKATPAIHIMPHSFVECWCGPIAIAFPQWKLGRFSFYVVFSLFYAFTWIGDGHHYLIKGSLGGNPGVSAVSVPIST